MKIIKYLLIFLCLVFSLCQPKEDEKQKEKCLEPTPSNQPPTSYCVQYPYPHQIEKNPTESSAIFVDSQDKIHIAYVVLSSGEKRVLHYANNISGDWKITIFNSLPVKKFNGLTIFVDSLGKVYIVFSDCSLSEDFPCRLQYLTNSAGKWTFEIIKEEGDDYSSGPFWELETRQFKNLSLLADKDFIYLSYISSRYNGDKFFGYVLQHTARLKTAIGKSWQTKALLSTGELWDKEIRIQASAMVADVQGNFYLAAQSDLKKDDTLYFQISGNDAKEYKMISGLCQEIGNLAIDDNGYLYFVCFGKDIHEKPALYFGSNKNGSWQFENLCKKIPYGWEWGSMEMRVVKEKVYIFIGGLLGFGEEDCQIFPSPLLPELSGGGPVLLIKNKDGWGKHYLINLSSSYVFTGWSEVSFDKDGKIYLIFDGAGPFSTAPEDYNLPPIDDIKGVYYYSFSEEDPENLCANIENSETCCGCADFSGKCILDHHQWECPGGCFERYAWISSWQWLEPKFIEEKINYEEVTPVILP